MRFAAVIKHFSANTTAAADDDVMMITMMYMIHLFLKRYKY